MKLYFSPLACSLATRISLYEAGADAEYVYVDSKAKRTGDGNDFASISGLGLVPVLCADDGRTITENAAILQFVADRFPSAGLAPDDPRERTQLQQWLSFIGTELHKVVFVPLLDERAPPEVKAYALARADARLAWLAAKLDGRSFLLDRLSVADAYLFAVLNWSVVTPIDLRAWPSIAAYMKRLHGRPAFARAFEEEKGLWVAELQRRGAPLPELRV